MPRRGTPKTAMILAGAFAALLAALVCERLALKRRLSRIPLRICVTGTRGKSSVARMLASVLRCDGRSVLAKTTGSRGIHVYVPIVRGPVQKDVWMFAKEVALLLKTDGDLAFAGVDGQQLDLASLKARSDQLVMKRIEEGVREGALLLLAVPVETMEMFESRQKRLGFLEGLGQQFFHVLVSQHIRPGRQAAVACDLIMLHLLCRGGECAKQHASERERERVRFVRVVGGEELARRFWGDTSPVGERIRIGTGAGTPCEIVGVARDGKYNSLTEKPAPYIYFPFSQRFAGEATLVVRTAGDERAIVGPLRREMESIDRAVPALQIMTMRDHLRAATAVERLTAALVSALGLLGLFLAVVGLYGLVSYLVGRRTREIGIRMAVGARPADIARDTLRQAAVPIAAGLVLGTAIAIVVTSLTARSIYGISAADPLMYAGTSVALAVVTVAASLIPARRASRVDPAHALRSE